MTAGRGTWLNQFCVMNGRVKRPSIGLRCWHQHPWSSEGSYVEKLLPFAIQRGEISAALLHLSCTESAVQLSAYVLFHVQMDPCQNTLVAVSHKAFIFIMQLHSNMILPCTHPQNSKFNFRKDTNNEPISQQSPCNSMSGLLACECRQCFMIRTEIFKMEIEGDKLTPTNLCIISINGSRQAGHPKLYVRNADILGEHSCKLHWKSILIVLHYELPILGGWLFRY